MKEGGKLCAEAEADIHHHHHHHLALMKKHYANKEQKLGVMS
jgi:hypothetical protein